MSNSEPAPYIQNENSDEIDLRDLALMLIEGWHWIIGSIIVAFVAALVYLAVSKPTYEVHFKAIPAASANFSGFNFLSGFSITPKDAYRTLSNQLSSYQNFSDFVEKHSDMFDLDEKASLSKVFSDRFSMRGSNGDNQEISLTYRYPEGEQGAEVLNTYVRTTSQDVWAALRSRFDDYNRAQVIRLSSDLELQKESLQRAREDRLYALEQALDVAKRLDIEKPTTPQLFGWQSVGNEVFYANISGDDNSLPLYLMGYQILKAERDVLSGAIDTGLNNNKIRNIEKHLEQRQGITALLDSGRLYGIDQGVEPNFTERLVEVVEYAYPPSGSSGPSKVLVLALSLMLGGMFGVVLVFLMRFAKSLKAYRQEIAD